MDTFSSREFQRNLMTNILHFNTNLIAPAVLFLSKKSTLPLLERIDQIKNGFQCQSYFIVLFLYFHITGGVVLEPNLGQSLRF